MLRLLAATITAFFGLSTFALAQMTVTPGPGGILLAPGSPVHGYTPGGIGPGGIEIAPGPAARNIPMYRVGPGDIALPLRPDARRDESKATVRLDPRCSNDIACDVQAVPQNLILTINSRDAGPGEPPSPEAPIDSLRDLFAVLRTCWEPPAREQAQEGVQMSVRLSFRRTGEIIAPPFVTYTTPGTKAETKQAYRQAINASFERCTPLPFSRTFSGAIAGRPINVRYIDDRNTTASSPQP
jgi:hypothetical protein